MVSTYCWLRPTKSSQELSSGYLTIRRCLPHWRGEDAWRWSVAIPGKHTCRGLTNGWRSSATFPDRKRAVKVSGLVLQRFMIFPSPPGLGLSKQRDSKCALASANVAVKKSR